MIDNMPQKVKNEGRRETKNQGSLTRKFERMTFTTSREMDFFSEKELVTQTGHPKDEWPLVFIKEAIDNALDACEEADTPPIVSITADTQGISVKDNGPGLPEATLKAALDFSVRASNREAYVSPSRGAQGNALKTLFPMARVIDAEHGMLVVEAHGKRHAIVHAAGAVRLDLSSEQLDEALVRNLREANERAHAIEAYLKTGRGGAATNASRNRLRREATRRVERARIALWEARAIMARLKREADRVPWAEVVG